jgi:hypothetical protein
MSNKINYGSRFHGSTVTSPNGLGLPPQGITYRLKAKHRMDIDAWREKKGYAPIDWARYDAFSRLQSNVKNRLKHHPITLAPVPKPHLS